MASDQVTGTVHRSIVLHDRLLPIDDIRVIKGDTKVSIKELARYFYLSLEQTNDKVSFEKRGKVFEFDRHTGKTSKNGQSLTWEPFVEKNNEIYASVRYIAHELGFRTHYFKKQQTIRIYRDDYPHLSNKEFEERLHQLKQPSSSKATVYLTFDDGPNRHTKKNMATLNAYGVKGTFFFLGDHMQTNAHQQIVRSVASSGHYIGSHSTTHNKDIVYQSATSFLSEMEGAARQIEQLTGQPAPLMRVPYGSKPHVTSAMRQKMQQKGYKMWDWDVDSEDWKQTNPSKIVERVQRDVLRAERAGDRHIVILLHDLEQTTKALPTLIEWLQQEGYSLKTYEPNDHIVQNFWKDPTL